MAKRIIKKVAVLGSGVMGSRIACHFAGCGVEVLLLDIEPAELNEKEKAKGLTPDSKEVKNRIVNESLQAALKSNPSPVHTKDAVERNTTGKLTDEIRQ